jgi:hypothetical protein
MTRIEDSRTEALDSMGEASVSEAVLTVILFFSSKENELEELPLGDHNNPCLNNDLSCSFVKFSVRRYELQI